MKKILSVLAILSIALSYACSSSQQESTPIQLMRKPYLQSALADSISILWRTDKGTEAKVAYKSASQEDWAFVKGITRPTNTNWVESVVTLTGLSPNTYYEYQIFVDKQQLLAEQALYFTSPVADQDSLFSFFAVGDIGEPVEESGTPDQLGKALAKYVDSVQFGLLLGDIIYPDGKSEDYDKNLFQYFGEVFPYVPTFPILGNHDWHEPEENYMKEWKLPGHGNGHYYSFNYGTIHFVGLDTKNGELHEYDKQVAWLEEDLANVPDKYDWKIVFLHHNGKSCTYKNDYEAVVSLYPIFEEYGVDLVLNGHAHTYERLNPMNGKGEVVAPEAPSFTSITVGSGGKLRGVGTDAKPFEPNPEDCRHPGLVAASVHDWVFLKLDVQGDKLIGTAFNTDELRGVDSFTIEKK